jgi:hypothetical protein
MVCSDMIWKIAKGDVKREVLDRSSGSVKRFGSLPRMIGANIAP